MPSELLKCHKLSARLSEIINRLEELTRRYNQYAVVNNILPVTRPLFVDPRLQYLYKEESQLVGISNLARELTAILSSNTPQEGGQASNQKIKIVSVPGPGGLGKTTAVKGVSDNLKGSFHLSAFVPVGRNPDFTKVFRDILIGIEKDKYMDKVTSLDEKQLIGELRQRLQGEKYFVVLDAYGR